VKRTRLLAFAALPFVISACSPQPVNAPATVATPNGPTIVTQSGPATVTATLAQKAHVTIQPTASGCQNNPGPYITLNGELALSGVKARVILSNNAKFTHVTSQDVVGDAVIIPAGDKITINKQPSRGGAGGNPWIYLQFKSNGQAIGSPQLLGRCVQGLNNAAVDFSLATGANMTVTSGGCSNHPGPYVTLDGELKLGGLDASLIFTNNARFTHVAAADVVVDVVLIPAGQSITFHKQPPLGGAGGNPFIYVQFLGGAGDPLGTPILLGRCVQISN
jgi:hypothetical protein